MSEVTNLELKDEAGQKIFELQTKFVRYQLILDDDTRLEELIVALGGTLIPKPKAAKPVVRIPKLYSRDRK